MLISSPAVRAVVQLSVSGTVPQVTWSCRISLERSHRGESDGASHVHTGTRQCVLWYNCLSVAQFRKQPGRVVYRWKGLIAGNPMVPVTCTLAHVSDCDHAKCGAVCLATAIPFFFRVT
jgi:hypothetical protein